MRPRAWRTFRHSPLLCPPSIPPRTEEAPGLTFDGIEAGRHAARADDVRLDRRPVRSSCVGRTQILAFAKTVRREDRAAGSNPAALPYPWEITNPALGIPVSRTRLSRSSLFQSWKSKFQVGKFTLKAAKGAQFSQR